MNILYIALQDGFNNDSVRITVNGLEVHRKSGVTTNRVISLAEAIETAVTDSTATVEVEVSSRNITGSFSVEPGDTPYLAVSIRRDGKLEFLTAKEPFRYM
jgi:hypothetical protein